MMAWFYFVRPIESLVHKWQIKLPAAVILAYAWDFAEHMAGVYAELLSMPSFLIGMATIAFFGDFLAAVVSAYEENGIKGIDLIKFRQLAIKAAYWIIVIGAFSNLATGATKAGYPVIPKFDDAAVIWLSMQDTWSAIENWKGEGAGREWVKGAYDLARGDLSIDQVSQHND